MPLIAEWRGHIPALTTDQMREVDRVMVTEMGISLIQMMENAGRHLAVLARELCGGRVESKKIVVLAGRGNNGGGGLVAVRRLANWGADVGIITPDPAENYADVPQMQLNILRKMGVPISTAADGLALLSKADLILDALIGYGLRGAPKNANAILIRAANASGVKILALDAPSGLDTTTG
ncbi:MAG TPA: NAD(P)H-hydrate epimerase, partial [Anaerolineae bacterium]